jgi:hypothetical protein
MNLFNKVLLIVSIVFYTGVMMAQEPNASYKLANGMAIITFDKSCLDQQTEACQPLYDFKDFGLKKGIIECVKGKWVKDGWELIMISKDVYQLKKSMNEFKNTINPYSKYDVDLSYWKYPFSTTDVDNVTLPKKIAKVDKNGNATFFVKGFKEAKKVILTGSFNDWSEDEIEMNKVKDGWQVKMMLSSGLYEYKFIIDGNWTHDIGNSAKVMNEHFTFNSILSVGKKYRFQLFNLLKSKNIYIVGSFNNWEEKALRMNKTKDGWETTFALPPGKHLYKFLVDGQWILDPNNNLEETDGNGNVNSVLIIPN